MFTNIPLICAVIAVIACFYAAYSDLKSGIISNKLTFPLIGIGIALNALNSFIINDPWFIVKGLIFIAIVYIISYIFWRMGAWAGGDAKLFTALAALLPVQPLIIQYSLFNVNFPVISNYGFPITIILNSIISLLPFLLIYVLFIVLSSKRYLIDELISPIKDYKKNIISTLVITSAGTLTVLIAAYLPYKLMIILLILIFIFSFIISKLPDTIKAVVITVLTLYALYTGPQLTIISIITLFVTLTIVRIILKILTTITKKALQDDYKVEELKEGMIPAFKIYEQDDKIIIDDKGIMDKIRESAKKGDVFGLMRPEGKLLIGTMAAGLSQDDINFLNKLVKENRIENKITIKKGIQFAPSILIGVIISLFIGDLVLILQKIFYMIYY
ncbi:MAG: A24 family peptidase C-terminal domain-containing protein [Methanobacterium sp.]|nr:A24 family peptidase C-terminal domain-containing protein [Methanobacterium sp.]